MTPWALLRAYPFTSKCLRVPRSTFNSIMLYDQGRERQSSRQEVELGEVGRGEGGELPKVYANTQDLNSQTHRQGYWQLCRWIPGGQSDPLVGAIKFWPPHPCPYGTVPCEENSIQLTQIHPWTRVAEYAPSRSKTEAQDPDPFAHPVFPPGASTPGHREPILITDVAPSCPSEDRPFPPHPLGGNHKNKPGASFVPRGMFSPCSHFMKLFGPEPRQWSIYEASQRYPRSSPSDSPALTSLAIVFGSLAADVFKLPHLLSARRVFTNRLYWCS